MAVLAGDKSKAVAHMTVQAGQAVSLDASGSSDPDGDDISCRWFIYKEAGSCRGDVEIEKRASLAMQLTTPQVDGPKTIHVILEIQDSGRPPLYSYRRMILNVQP